MDPMLLAALPDAAKLGILRHLGRAAAPPSAEVAAVHDGSGGGDADADVTQPLLVGRSMAGGLAIVDGFLDAGEVQVRLPSPGCGVGSRGPSHPGETCVAFCCRGP